VSAPIPSVYLQIDDNPNCNSLAGLIFQPRTVPAPIERIRYQRQGTVDWYEITGIDAEGKPVPATACIIDDSGDGACYLIVGGEWGLRFRRPSTMEWSFDDPNQWGEPYLVAPADDEALIFCPSTQS
jgi:hypothetical protein